MGWKFSAIPIWNLQSERKTLDKFKIFFGSNEEEAGNAHTKDVSNFKYIW